MRRGCKIAESGRVAEKMRRAVEKKKRHLRPGSAFYYPHTFRDGDVIQQETFAGILIEN